MLGLHTPCKLQLLPIPLGRFTTTVLPLRFRNVIQTGIASFHVLSISGNNIVVDNIKDTKPVARFHSYLGEKDYGFRKYGNQVYIIMYYTSAIIIKANCWYAMMQAIWSQLHFTHRYQERLFKSKKCRHEYFR